jgi:hypothetical protein
MFKFAEMFKDVMQMRGRLSKIQKSLEKLRVEAEVAGGLVRVQADGKQNVLKIEISDELVERQDRKMLEDLIKSCVNEALKKSRAEAEKEMKKALENLPLDKLGL